MTLEAFESRNMKIVFPHILFYVAFASIFFFSYFGFIGEHSELCFSTKKGIFSQFYFSHFKCTYFSSLMHLYYTVCEYCFWRHKLLKGERRKTKYWEVKENYFRQRFVVNDKQFLVTFQRWYDGFGLTDPAMYWFLLSLSLNHHFIYIFLYPDNRSPGSINDISKVFLLQTKINRMMAMLCQLLKYSIFFF